MRLYEFKIGYRYTRGAKNKFASFSSWMSMLGVIIGVTSLIITLSVMNGFKINIVNNILKKMSHVSISTNNELEIEKMAEIEEHLSKRDDISKIEKEYLISAGVSNNIEFWGAYILGITDDGSNKIDDSIVDDLKPKSFNVVVSKEMANLRKLKIGDELKFVLNAHKQVTPVGSIPRQRTFKISGVYETGQSSFDNVFILMNAQDAKAFSLLENPNSLQINLDDFWKAQELRQELETKFNAPDTSFKDWATTNKKFLTLLKIEKVIAMIILMLIIVVASFNMISTMVMSVAEKKGQIAILRTIGCRPSSIMTIFVLQGCFIGFIGTTIGLVLGVLGASYVNEIVMFVDKTFKFNFLTDVLNEMKVSAVIIKSEVAIIVLSSLVITLISAIYPSWMASKVNPAEALKNE